MNAGIVLAGGTGERFGGKTSKQYCLLDGKEVISFAIDALKKSKSIDKVIVVAKEQFLDRLQSTYGITAIQGGSSRNASLKNALDYIKQNFNCDRIIILEAARPMITSEIVDGYIQKLDEYDSVITGQRIVDSLGCLHTHTANRADYYLIQAPEAFKFDMLYENFKSDSPLTATNQQMPENSTLYINFDFVNNNKITYFADLAYCETLMHNEQI